MAGLWSGDPEDSLTLEQAGTSVIPTTTGQALGAIAGETLAHLPSIEGIREQAREVQAGQAVDDLGRPIDVGPVKFIQPDEANAKYGIPDVGQEKGLKFEAPIPEETAHELYDQKRASLARQDLLKRWEHGLLGETASFGTQLAVGLMDPLNIATGFIPGLGPARTAALMERAGEAFLPRLAARAATGAAGGFVGTAAMLPMQIAAAQQEHEDFSFGDAARELLLGSVIGGVAHSVFGAVSDRVFGIPETERANENRLAGLHPEDREAVLTGGLANLIEGRTVDLGPAIELVDAKRGETELLQWYRQQRLLDDAAQTALGDISRQEAATAAAGRSPAVEARLANLRDQAAALRTELAEAHRQAEAAIDVVTPQRLEQVEWELASSGLPAARRAELEAERTMLTQGRARPVEAEALEAARSQALAAGLGAELERVERQQRLVEGQRARLAARTGQAEETLAQAQRSFRTQAARIDSRQTLLQDLAERTIRRLAGRSGIALERGEARAAARRVLGAEGGQVKDEIRQVIDSMARRVRGTDAIERAAVSPSLEATVNQAVRPLRQNAQRAASEMAAAAMREPRPEAAAVSRTADEIVARGPEKLEDVNREIAELQRMQGAELPTAEGIPFMITAAQRAELAARGHTAEEIRNMTPTRAQEILRTPTAEIDPDLAAAEALVTEAEDRAAGRDRAALCLGRG